MFEKYREFKESGVEWLGSVPKLWKVVALGSLMELKSDKNHPEFEVLSVYREYGVIKKDSRDDNHNATSEDTTNYKAVEPGDLVVNKMKAWQGSMGVSPYKGIVSPAYITCRIKSNEIISEYLHQLLRCNVYIGEYNRISYGVRVGQWDMHFEDFKRVTVLVPSLPEQTAIANFLDRKTAQIDQAIFIKEKQIELLKERRQILIHNAVTRGLDPDVKMKDSGVEWIGEIPEHWEIQPIKYSLNGIVDCEHSTAPFVDEPTYFVVRTSNVKNGNLTLDDAKYTHEKGYLRWTRRGIPEPGDILLTREAPAGEACLVPSDMKICLGQRMVWLKVDKAKLDSKLAIHLIYSKMIRTYIDFLSSGSTVLHFNMSDINNIPITLMPMEEQIRIRQYIESHSRKIGKSISIKQKEIEKLKEYKLTLINSAVTGKIKVS